MSQQSHDKSRRLTAVEALEQHMESNRKAATFAVVGLDFARAQAEAIDHLREELDQAAPSTTNAPFARVIDLIEAINADRYGKPLIAALHLCNDLASELSAPSAIGAPTPLERYALAVLDAHREEIGDLDGAFLQEQAEKYGLLESVPVTEACGEYCRCAEYDDFPQDCLRIKDEHMPKMAAHRKLALSDGGTYHPNLDGPAEPIGLSMDDGAIDRKGDTK